MTTRDKGITLSTYKYLTLSETPGVGFVVTSNGNITSPDTWALIPGGISPYNLTPVTSVAPQNSTIRGQDAINTYASTGGNINITPGVGSISNPSGNVIIKDTAGNGGAWNTSHPQLGNTHIWVDTFGRLRVKLLTAPIADTDGIAVGFDLTSSGIFAPPSLSAGTGVTTTLSIANAVLGDFAIASYAIDLQGITVTAYVSTANIVSVRFQNDTAGVIALASATLRVKVIKQ